MFNVPLPSLLRTIFFLFPFFFARYLGFCISWDILVLRDPRFAAEKKTKHIPKRLGRGTLNTCAKIQGLSLKNGVDIWSFVR